VPIGTALDGLNIFKFKKITIIRSTVTAPSIIHLDELCLVIFKEEKLNYASSKRFF